MVFEERTTVVTSLGFLAGDTKIWYDKYRVHRYHAKERGLLSSLSFYDYMFKLVQAGISKPDQIGVKTGQFVLARLGDTGDYSIENCRFITTHQNLQESTDNGRRIVAGEKISITKIGRRKETHPGVAAQAAKLAKTFVLIDPNGVEYHGSNVAAFCKMNGLDVFAIYNVIAGRRSQHKGWTAPTT